MIPAINPRTTPPARDNLAADHTPILFRTSIAYLPARGAESVIRAPYNAYSLRGLSERILIFSSSVMS